MLWRRSHRVCVIFVDTELHIAQKRVQQRYETTGRPVPPEFVISCHKDSRDVATKIEKGAKSKNIVDLFVRIKNDENDKDVELDPKDKEILQKFMGMNTNLSLMQRFQVFVSTWRYRCQGAIHVSLQLVVDAAARRAEGNRRW